MERDGRESDVHQAGGESKYLVGCQLSDVRKKKKNGDRLASIFFGIIVYSSLSPQQWSWR